MQGRLSSWLVKHGLVHRSLGFDYQGIETLQIKPEEWHSIAVILYVFQKLKYAGTLRTRLRTNSSAELF